MDIQDDMIKQLCLDDPVGNMRILDLTPVGIVDDIKDAKKPRKHDEDQPPQMDKDNAIVEKSKDGTDVNDRWKMSWGSNGKCSSPVLGGDDDDDDDDTKEEKRDIMKKQDEKKKKKKEKKKEKKKKDDDDDDDDVEKEKKNKKRRRNGKREETMEESPVVSGRKKRQTVQSSSSPRPAPKRKREKSPDGCRDNDDCTDGSAEKPGTRACSRKQPGYAMIKTEDDRLKYALECLVRKRNQRETGSKVSTSTCGVLTNDLIDFYEDVVANFQRKFGRYISRDE
jgi:hypothetical protein